MPVFEWEIEVDSLNTDDVVDKTVDHFIRELNYLPKEYLDEIIIEIKIIVFELVTNIRTHGEASRVKIKYTITDEELNLEFTSDGSGFKLKSDHDPFLKGEVLNPPFPEKYIGRYFTMYKGIEEELTCMISSSNKLIFLITPKNVFQNTNEIHEHFGLQLIATVAEKFEYHRNPDNLDVFLVQKKLKQF